MSNHNQTQATPYPPPSTAYTAEVQGGNVAPPPPAGYPVYEVQRENSPPRAKTVSRGDGFWKGCCAALCCCCLLDACF